MNYFCYLDSSGDLDHTNLQLYSLEQAADAWNELLDTVSDVGLNNVDRLQERLAFIVSCFGLSLSQLLGQNCPSPDREKIDQPGELLSNILNKTSEDRTTKRLLNSTFKDFLKYYGAIRHFGRNIDNGNYEMVQKLTINELDRFRKMTIKIWDLVINIYRQDKENEIDAEISSIADVVRLPSFSVQKL
ncbi:hypothetical protein [uncultured Desulfobacter sp.]|uniref:hypothetical protein n=1 Tax=uncultured Desulfobacter sp. TaxID=240139 RepID=UPI002AA85137|nr:hypothetical protein [uncultured Desulfobacter sp.]